MAGKNLVVLACNTGYGVGGAKLTQEMSNQLGANVITSQHLLMSGHTFNGSETALMSFSPSEVNTMNNFTLATPGGARASTIYNLSLNGNSRSPSYKLNDPEAKSKKILNKSYNTVRRILN